MAILIYLPWRLNLVLAISILVLHNIQDYFAWDNIQGFWAVVRAIFLNQDNFQLTPTFKIDFLYSILPYTGIMLLGFCLGRVFGFTYERRRCILLVTGSLMLVTFVFLRTFNIYGDPYTWSVQERGTIYTIMSFLNISKYPTSLQFTLFTLGIALILLVVLERESNQWMDKIRVTGQVAMFYYIIHIPFIRFLGKAYHAIYDHNPSYLLFFAMTFLIVIILIYISQKYANYKFSKKNDKRYWWLKYI